MTRARQARRIDGARQREEARVRKVQDDSQALLHALRQAPVWVSIGKSAVDRLVRLSVDLVCGGGAKQPVPTYPAVFGCGHCLCFRAPGL